MALAVLVASLAFSFGGGHVSAFGNCYADQFGGNVYVTEAACLGGPDHYQIRAVQFCAQSRYGFYQYGTWVPAKNWKSLTPTCAGTVTSRSYQSRES